MYAFIDETGNTGGNLFDKDQPIFLTAALITKSDFDRSCNNAFAKILEKAHLDEIHACELGLSGIEPIAIQLLRLLKKAKARFFVSRVEKRYLLATKFFDTFFDSGENPAIPWHAYNLRPLRLILTFKVSSLIDQNIAEMFWSMLMERSETRARALIPMICDSVIANAHKLPDIRSQQIIIEALEWSRSHTDGLDFYQAGRQAKNGHMPNMVAFANLMEGLEALSKKWKRRVRLIRHDRQSQFESSLAEWHLLFSNALPDPIHLPGETRILRKVHNSDFQITASESSPGIQVTDLILWLFKQFLTGRNLPYNTAKLLNFVFRNGMQNDFSFEGVEQSMLNVYGPTLNTNISDEQIDKASDLLAYFEKVRLDNIAAYDQDGLMPFER